MRASESSDWLSPSGAPGPMSVQEIREKPRDTTHPYAYANLERHAQPVEGVHASATNPAAAQPQLFPTLGGNMQAEQLGVPSLPITFMPGKAILAPSKFIILKVGAKVMYLCHITLANGSTLNQVTSFFLTVK